MDVESNDEDGVATVWTESLDCQLKHDRSFRISFGLLVNSHSGITCRYASRRTRKRRMNHVSPHQQLDEMITGYWMSQSIYAAAKFGIADQHRDKRN